LKVCDFVIVQITVRIIDTGIVKRQVNKAPSVIENPQESFTKSSIHRIAKGKYRYVRRFDFFSGLSSV
jgi:hypothetical protein